MAMRSLINPVRLAFSRDSAIPSVELSPAEFSEIKPENIRERAARLNDQNLDVLRGAAMRLESEIADKQAELADVLVVIASCEAKAAVLDGGARQAAE